MANPIWPPHISDRPLRDSIQWSPIDNVDDFQVEAGEGFGITGQRLGAEVVDYTGTFIMPISQWIYWMAWWDNDTKRGAIPFELAEPWEGITTRLWQIRPKNRIDPRRPFPTEVHLILPLRSLP